MEKNHKAIISCLKSWLRGGKLTTQCKQKPQGNNTHIA